MNLKLIILNVVAIIILSCQQAPKTTVYNSTKQKAKTNDTSALQVNQYTYNTTFSPDLGWGYQILNNGNLYINQPHIPAIPGKEGFTDEAKAIKTALFIINKLENNIFPPTISVDELDSLKVLK